MRSSLFWVPGPLRASSGHLHCHGVLCWPSAGHVFGHGGDDFLPKIQLDFRPKATMVSGMLLVLGSSFSSLLLPGWDLSAQDHLRGVWERTGRCRQHLRLSPGSHAWPRMHLDCGSGLCHLCWGQLVLPRSQPRRQGQLLFCACL